MSDPDEKLSPDSLLTSYQVGTILQVNPSSVNKWVKDGRIAAFRTPGGHRRIRAADVVAFLREHDMPIPKNLEDAARRRILWVDDESNELRAIARLFQEHEKLYELKTIENGIDALVAIGSYRPHLVVLDVRMPEVDGIEVCRRLKENEKTKHIRVVMVSGAMDEGVRAEASAAGAFLCLEKPFDLKEVLAAVEL